MHVYLGQCDKLRMVSEGEAFWQQMVKYPQKISKEKFLEHCNPAELLDEGETLDQWLQGDPEAGFYRNLVNGEVVYYIQHSGFEFIWI